MTAEAANRVFIIAEAGVNHNGSLDLALSLVDMAAEAGADAVKFQTFSADRLVTRAAAMADYQRRSSGSNDTQHPMLRRLELSENDHARLIAHCAARRIQFLSSPFDLQSLSMLVERFDLAQIKLGSGEVTNGPLLLAASRTGRNIILSTGMATLEEVEAALGVLAFGYAGGDARPGPAAFRSAFADAAARATLSRKVVLLHCTTAYPASFEDVNLRAMDTLRTAFGIPAGYSDHTPGIVTAVAAAARGAAAIEKHLTADRTLPGPDHAASLEPAELTRMIAAIRQVELALGDGIKAPRASELGNMTAARKSIVATRPIAAAEMLSPMNLAVKRPGNGLSPMNWWDLQDTPARRSYSEDEAVEL
jgi:N-acetylneuraminate synthase